MVFLIYIKFHLPSQKHGRKFDGVMSFETAPVLTAFPERMKQDVLSFIAKIGQYLGT